MEPRAGAGAKPRRRAERSPAGERDDPSTGKETRLRVVARVRPLTCLERRRGARSVVHCRGDDTVCVNAAGQETAFGVSAAFDAGASQERVFEGSGMKRLIELAASGFSCTAFAFGQTGSGKTYTLAGPVARSEAAPVAPGRVGLMQRAFVCLLEQSQCHGPGLTLSASYVEIHNEQVRDLLSPGPLRPLPVRWSKTRGFHVENLLTVEFQSLEAIVELLQKGARRRQSAAHALNGHSSRSHALLTVHLRRDATSPGLSARPQGTLCFVDLAGSERVKDTGSAGERLVEASNINRSLLALGHCISLLAAPGRGRRWRHIPYRDSRLTQLLAAPLGGAGITLMVACISPSSCCLSETLSTLRFARRAARVTTAPGAPRVSRAKLLQSLEQEIQALRVENLSLRQQLQLPRTLGESTATHAAPTKLPECQGGSQAPGQRGARSRARRSLCGLLPEPVWENEQFRREKIQLRSSRDLARAGRRALAQELAQELARHLDAPPALSSWGQGRRSPEDVHGSCSSQALRGPRPAPCAAPGGHLLLELPWLEELAAESRAGFQGEKPALPCPQQHPAAPGPLGGQRSLAQSKSPAGLHLLPRDVHPQGPEPPPSLEGQVVPSAPPLPGEPGRQAAGAVPGLQLEEALKEQLPHCCLLPPGSGCRRDARE